MIMAELGEWIEWSGGVCPVPVHTEIEYRLRWMKAGDEPLCSEAGYCRWDHGRTPEGASTPSLRRNDIVAYRVVQP